jgi:hypothetical protein
MSPRHRWVVWFNANGVIYEQAWCFPVAPSRVTCAQILDFLDIYSREIDANVIVFNYRGVGASSGWPNTAADLTSDGATCLLSCPSAQHRRRCCCEISAAARCG